MNVKDIAIRNILKRKMNAESVADENLNKVLKDDRMKALFVKCKQLVVEIAKIDVGGGNSKKQRDEYNKNRELMAEILKEIGVDKALLKPQYTCSKCKDSGYVGVKECECLKKEISKIQIKESGVDLSSLPSFTDDFEIFDKKKKEVQAIYEKMKMFVDKLDTTNFDNVLIIGNTGVGKTYLMGCMTSYAVSLSRSIKYTTMFGFNQDMLKYHLAKLEEKESILYPYLNSEILFIDDMGTENKINNVTNEYLYLVINERMQNHKKTVITTNLDLKQIQDTYGERIFSRLMHKKQSLLINFPGVDLRIKGCK